MSAKHTTYSARFKDMLGSAFLASREGDFQKVMDLCRKLEQEAPNCKPVQILLGEALWRTGHLAEALMLVEKAVSNHLSSRVLSLLYFQLLIESNEILQAKNEISRFLGVQESTDHLGLIEDHGWNKTEILHSDQRIGEDTLE